MKQRDRLRTVAPLLVEAMEAVEKDDIVERLRTCHGIQVGDTGCWCIEAADEIKRLRAAIKLSPEAGAIEAMMLQNRLLREKIKQMRQQIILLLLDQSDSSR
jgi:hypothetical protein